MQESSSIRPSENWARRLRQIGRGLALAGVILPLLLIGGMKFTQVEVEALKPIIGGTPWLAWLYPALGFNGASYLIGVIELTAALLLILSPWVRWAAILGAALAACTFAVTCSIMIALPIWEPTLGFPALSGGGQFLIKDVALLGIALVLLGEALGGEPRA
ncbi:MAG TPA: DUF417 family protein [Sphingomicrobium sp.]